MTPYVALSARVLKYLGNFKLFFSKILRLWTHYKPIRWLIFVMVVYGSNIRLQSCKLVSLKTRNAQFKF